MKDRLAIETIIQNKNTNAKQTINKIVIFLEGIIGNVWTLLRKRQGRVSFSREHMEEGIDTKLTSAWNQMEVCLN